MTRQKLDNIRDNMSRKMLFHPSKWQDFPRVSRVTKLSKMTGETEISVWRARVIVANSDMAGSRVPMFHIQTIGVINRYMLPFRSHLFIPPCVSWKGKFFFCFFLLVRLIAVFVSYRFELGSIRGVTGSRQCWWVFSSPRIYELWFLSFNFWYFNSFFFFY